MTTLITGASSGIGKKITADLLLKGESILAIGKREIREDEYKEYWGTDRVDKFNYYNVNLTSVQSLYQLINRLQGESNFIDKFIHSAGIVDRSDFVKMRIDSWDDVLNVNLNSAMMISKSLIPKMIENKMGRIIFITSQMGTIPHPFASPSYSVSKAGLHALSKNIALHYSQFNILCNCVAPGSINTPMFMSLPQDRQDTIKKNIPCKSLGNEEDLSELVDFLLFRNKYITGQEIHVNGGSLMY
jgi:3-oxoacyl-[acyl-carrier protein] reductase